MGRTAFVYHPEFLEHDTGPGHPERADRLRAILARLERNRVLDALVRLAPEEAPLEALARVHAPAHIERVARFSAQGGLVGVTPDTVASPSTFRAARLAAGAVLQAIDAVMAGQVNNAFCAVRPPGHHAERDQAMGFCFFNNVAVGARHAQDRYSLRRVAIIDWDVHHGNGTQHSFEEDETVFFFSIHQYPHYPGTGSGQERGQGRGLGFTLNAPMPAGSTDQDYVRVFQEQLRPALDEFRPQLLLLSAGFDAHWADPLGQVRLTEEGYALLTREILDAAAAHARGRLVSVLEGGYDLEATSASVEAHLRELMQG
jgi:acetoin utilization deacetylase AcuC-like enzyme